MCKYTHTHTKISCNNNNFRGKEQEWRLIGVRKANNKYKLTNESCKHTHSF